MSDGKTTTDVYASYPWGFGKDAWKRIAKRIYINTEKQRLNLIAAGIAFYLVLSIFPLLAAFISIFGLVVNPDFISDQLSTLLQAIPSEGRDVVQKQLEGIAMGSTSSLSLGLVISVATALWSSSKGSRALISGMNVVYKEDEKRSLVKLYFVSFLFTFGLVIMGVIVPLALSLFPIAISYVFPGQFETESLVFVRWVAAFIIAITSLAVLRHFGPSRKNPKWRWVSFGSLATTLIWMIGFWLLGFYFKHTSSLEFYGSLGGVIALMFWVYLAAYILLLGAQLDAEMEHETLKDSTIGKDEKMGDRDAVVADTKARNHES